MMNAVELRETTDETAELEDCNGEEEGRFHAEELADFPPEGPESAEGEKVRGAVPGDLCEAVELIRDFGYSRADDRLSLVRDGIQANHMLRRRR